MYAADCPFSWGRAELETDKQAYKKSTFGITDTPEFLAALPAAAMIYLRGDVQEAQHGFYAERVKGNETYAMTHEYILYGRRAFEPFIGLIGKSGMSFDDKLYDESYNDNNILYKAKYSYDNNLPYVSDTGELSSDLINKIVKMNTPRSQAVSGFIGGESIELDDVKFEITNAFATVYVNSLSQSPLYNCENMLITAVGDTRNTRRIRRLGIQHNGYSLYIKIELITGGIKYHLLLA